jgi:zinc protease
MKVITKMKNGTCLLALWTAAWLSTTGLVLAGGSPEAGSPEAGSPEAGSPETGNPATRSGGVYYPETFTLENGLQVVVVTNRRAPVVTQMVWYKVGAADEPRGKSGIAHFLEHLMFKGTDEVAPGDFSKIIARHGGRDNAFTSWDFTAYFQTVARDDLELVMRMESDRMRDLRLVEEQVLPERGVILEERRQRVENEARFQLDEQMGAALFIHHSYGIPIIGWEHEMAGLTQGDAENFYQTWYRPNNAILLVVGDVDAETVRPLAEKYYGAVAAGPVPPRQRLREPPVTAERRLTLRSESVQQPAISFSLVAPSYHPSAFVEEKESRHAYPLEVLEDIMGGGTTGRLYRRLVMERRLASAVQFEYSGLNLDYGVINLWASPTPGTAVEVLEQALTEELARMVSGGVEEAEVAASIRRMLTDSAYARDSLMGPAYSFGMTLATGGTVEDIELWPERIRKVTKDQVNEAIQAVFANIKPVVGILLPAGGT